MAGLCARLLSGKFALETGQPRVPGGDRRSVVCQGAWSARERARDRTDDHTHVLSAAQPRISLRAAVRRALQRPRLRARQCVGRPHRPDSRASSRSSAANTHTRAPSHTYARSSRRCRRYGRPADVAIWFRAPLRQPSHPPEGDARVASQNSKKTK